MPAKNLPLFSDRPSCARPERTTQTAAAPAPPPAVVNASPGQPQAAKGQVALVLPANPSEVVGGTAHVHAHKPERPWPRSLPGHSLKGFQANLDAGIHESGWPLVIVGDRDGAPMVLGARRHLFDGQQRGSADGSACASGAAVDVLHRPARSHEPPVPHSFCTSLTTMASPPASG